MWGEFKNNLDEKISACRIREKASIGDHNESPCWIYFLYNIAKSQSKTVVYVGQSVNPRKRVKEHVRDEEKVWDFYDVLPVTTHDPNIDEAYYIKTYDPQYNNSLPKNPIFITEDKFMDIYPGDERKVEEVVNKLGIWFNMYGQTYINMLKFYDETIGDMKVVKDSDLREK